MTTADYNYPVNNPQYIALSLLPDGIYRLPVGVDIGMYGINSAVVENTLMQNNPILFLSTVNGNKRVVAFPGDFSTYSGSVGGEAILMFTLDSSNTLVDSNGTVHSVITTAEVIDNLTTPYSISPLSANQGMALNNKITPDSSSGAPTTATVGILGKIYIDTATNNAYMCTAVDDVTQSYTWKQITS